MPLPSSCVPYCSSTYEGADAVDATVDLSIASGDDFDSFLKEVKHRVYGELEEAVALPHSE